MFPLDVTHPARAMEPLGIVSLTNLGQLFPHLILRSTDKHATFSRFPPTVLLECGLYSIRGTPLWDLVNQRFFRMGPIMRFNKPLK